MVGRVFGAGVAVTGAVDCKGSEIVAGAVIGGESCGDEIFSFSGGDAIVVGLPGLLGMISVGEVSELDSGVHSFKSPGSSSVQES